LCTLRAGNRLFVRRFPEWLRAYHSKTFFPTPWLCEPGEGEQMTMGRPGPRRKHCLTKQTGGKRHHGVLNWRNGKAGEYLGNWDFFHMAFFFFPTRLCRPPRHGKWRLSNLPGDAKGASSVVQLVSFGSALYCQSFYPQY